MHRPVCPLVGINFHFVLGDGSSHIPAMCFEEPRKLAEVLREEPSNSCYVNVNVDHVYSGHALSSTSTKLS